MLPKRLEFLKGSGGQAGLLPAVRLEPLAPIAARMASLEKSCTRHKISAHCPGRS